LQISNLYPSIIKLSYTIYVFQHLGCQLPWMTFVLSIQPTHISI